MTYAFGNIVIFHPAAIGDALLASPVAKTLKLNFPGAKITYWSHQSLRQLIFGLCPSVDDFVDFSKDTGFFSLIRTIKQLKPDLLVDLSNSTKGQILPYFTPAMVLRYAKQRVGEDPVMHAVDNFMQTIAPVCEEMPKEYFPTIFPDALAAELLPDILKKQNITPGPMIGIVPGVGKLRPHRAWLFDGWEYLLQAVIERGSHTPVLIGGEDEVELCAKLKESVGEKCLNLAGRVALTETAAILESCEVVISGDTGPAHLAVAVGTPVIGLYGPTSSARSGPYGYAKLVLDQNSSCQCVAAKFCEYTGTSSAGECMTRIMLAEIIDRLEDVIPGFASMGEDEVTQELIDGSYRKMESGNSQ